MTRCPWCLSSEKMKNYHDEEWGVPLHDDRKLFEYMLLDSFQAGLSWSTVINKRENFRKAFKNFDPEKISIYGKKQIEKLMQDAGIIRNRLKINATITNAKAFIAIRKSYGSFDKYIWQFTGGKTIINKWKSLQELPSKTIISDKMSKDLLQKGFKFVGSTICYAFMQAAGMINDHLISCYRYKELKNFH
ncbi:MAG: DNA-3-methyladenine glycosylase [Bacteroidetes bacterium RIFCSPLOWO2_12_FULL_37_12]|nr:MAG: DNA-3-methyladenine glycosylase [Bacteroidetes bacterium RIFCSPLOWO2_12_FULL_37_12]